MARRDAAGVPVGAGGGRIVSLASDGCQVGRQPSVVRSRDRERRVLQSWNDRALRIGSPRAWPVVLPAAVLGVRDDRAGALSRSRSGRVTRDRNRLLL